MGYKKEKLTNRFFDLSDVKEAQNGFIKYMKSLPNTFEVNGINISEKITPDTSSKELMNIFDCYNKLLADYKKRLNNTFDKKSFIEIEMQEIPSIENSSLSNDLEVFEKPDWSKIVRVSWEKQTELLMQLVIQDLRSGYNRKLIEYAIYLIGEKTKNDDYEFNLNMTYQIGLSAAYAAIELLNNPLK